MSGRKKTPKKSSGFPAVSYKLIALFGILLISVSLFYHALRITRLSFAHGLNVQNEHIQTKNPIPTFISIPDSNIYLSVEESSIINGVWQISELGASHLDRSARPGDKGNIIIYAHNTNERFGKIKNIEKGAKISLTSKDGKIHSYSVTETLEVKPKDIEVLRGYDKQTLTIYTCSGFADTKRFVVKAIPAHEFSSNL